MNQSRKSRLVITAVLICVCVIFLGVALTAIVLSFGAKQSVIDSAVKDLEGYGEELKPIAQSIIEEPRVVPARYRIRPSEGGISQMIVINANYELVYPRRFYDNEELEVIRAISEEMIDETLGGNTVSRITDLNNTQVLLLSLPVVRDNSVMGVLVLSKPLLNVYELSGMITNSLLLTSALSLVCAIVAGILLFKRVNSQVTALSLEKEGLMKLEEMRRTYIANITHELRAPLTGIRGFVEPLMDGIIEKEEDVLESYQIILNETLRLERLINDTLTLSSLQSANQSLELERIDIRNILVGCCKRFADRRAVHLICPDNLPKVQCNEDKLTQLLIILVDNAIKFSKEDVFVTAGEEEGFVVLRVKDTGSGITKEDLPYIFERFYKADKSRSGEGTGLGLSIAKEIVSLLKGEIGAESQLNMGTTLWVKLNKA